LARTTLVGHGVQHMALRGEAVVGPGALDVDQRRLAQAVDRMLEGGKRKGVGFAVQHSAALSLNGGPVTSGPPNRHQPKRVSYRVSIHAPAYGATNEDIDQRSPSPSFVNRNQFARCSVQP